MEAKRTRATRSNQATAQTSRPLVSSSSANKHQEPKYAIASDSNMMNCKQSDHDQSGAAEIARCYQEVDQIYDFIRGLAPLPLELRRIKSIDFEVERSRRPIKQPPTKASSSADKSTREADKLKQPRNYAKPRDSANLFRRLLPLKVTAGNVGPQIKKVESLSVDKTAHDGKQRERVSPQVAAKTRDKHKAIEAIRLPRAQSTSNLQQTANYARRHLFTPNLKPGSQQISNLLLWNPNVPLKLTSARRPTAARPTSMVIQTLPTPSSSQLKWPHLGGGSKPAQGIGDRLSPSIRMIDNGSQPTSVSASPTTEPDESPTTYKRHNIDLNLALHRAPRNVTSSPKSESSECSAVSISSDSSTSSGSGSTTRSSNCSPDERAKKGSRQSANSDASSATTTSDTSSQSDTSRSSESEPEPEPESQSESESSQKKSFTEATKNKKRKQISTTTSASSRANEIEKSPSDYENDTTSFMSSDRCETPVSREDGKLVGSRSSSSGRPSSPHTNERSDNRSRRRNSRSTSAQVADDVQSEHIYEQIPALKNLAPNHDHQSRASSHRHHHQAKPFVYPVAYAHDIGGHRYSHQNTPRSVGKHAPNAYIASTKGGLMAAQSLNRLNSMHDMHNSLPIYPNHQNLDRRRAKANKLHPVHNFMLHPLVRSRESPMFYKGNMSFGQQPNPQRQLSMNNLHLIPFMNPIAAQYSSRHLNPGAQSLQRSSSSTRVNLRAPRVTPGQLVAQTVMQLNNPTNRRAPQHAFLMWHPGGQQQASRPEAGTRQSQQLPDYPSYGHQPTKATNMGSNLVSKRRNPRRLTAIGIEQAYLPAARNLGAYKSRYFEPVQLLEAPLIDEDDEAQLGQARHANQTVSSKARPLDSISDLQSDSSSSGQHTTPDESSEDPGDQIIVEASRQAKSANSRQRKSSDDNFVSSSSFIKCYYGRELDDSSSQRQPHRAQAEAGDKHKPTRTARKKSGGDKLLGLIGLSSAASVSQQAAKPASLSLGGDAGSCREPQQASASARRLVATNATTKTKSATPIRLFEHPTVQVARLAGGNESHKLQRSKQHTRSSDKSPNAKESPISAASLRKRLANVLALAGSGHGNRTSADQQSDSNTNDSTSSYEAAIKNGQSESQLEAKSEELGTKAKQAPAKPERQPKVQANPASGSGSTKHNGYSNPQTSLIKVPKLSKQSHLLSRPLPTPPSQSSSALRAPIGASQAQSTAHWLTSGSKSHNGSQRASQDHSVAAKQSQHVPAKGRKSTAPNGSLNASSKAPQSAEPRPRSSATKPLASGNASMAADASSQSLSPLAVAINGNTNHSSPTVTTCTSSGISSRLTVGTHLAANSNSIGSSLSQSQRALAAKQKAHHGQTADKLNGAASAGSAQSKPIERGESRSFALMDEQCDDDDAEHPSATKQPADVSVGSSQLRPPKTSPAKHRMISPTSELGDDDNLRRFDEKFSNPKFCDNRLASSEDSLLESIDAITQQPNRKKQQAQTLQRLDEPTQIYTTNKPIITISQRQCI